MKTKFSKLEKSWILYDVANSAFVLIMVTAIMPIFFKDIAASSLSNADATSYWGFANSISALILALSAPILGAIADFKDTKKKLFAIFLVSGLSATLLLVFFGNSLWFISLFIFIIARIGYSGANIFYDSFITDVTKKDRMDLISTHGFGWGYIGSVVPFLFVIACVLLIKNPEQSSAISPLAAKISFLIVVIWWFLFSIPLLKNVKQNYYVKNSNHVIKESFQQLYQTFSKIKMYKNAFTFLLAYFFYIDGVYTIISMASAYGRDVGLSVSSLILAILMIQIVAFPFTLLYGKMSEYINSKSLIAFGILVYAVITVIAFYLPVIESMQTKIILFWLLAFLVASSQGGIQALSRSIFGKIIPKDKSSEFFGFYNIFGKFAAIMGPALMGITSKLAGHSRYGVLSIIVLFIIGINFLRKVEV